MLMPEKSLTDHALELADHKWGPVQPLAGYLSELQQSNAPDLTERKWYVLQCEPQRERTAASHLIGRRFKVYLPTETRRQTRRGRKIDITRPLFPGYLFARLSFMVDGSRLKFIHNTPGIRGGVHSFLMVNERPATIADKIMEAVAEVEKGEMIPKKPAASFKAGQQVRVVDGPFSSFYAVVEEIVKLEPEQRIRALVDLFGRQTPVEFEGSQLKPL